MVSKLFDVWKIRRFKCVFDILDHFTYGNKYTSPQSQRKILPDEILSTQRHIRLLDDDSIITEQKKTTRTMPLDDYNELKHVCINVQFFKTIF